jgi:hypothetical protein
LQRLDLLIGPPGLGPGTGKWMAWSVSFRHQVESIASSRYRAAAGTEAGPKRAAVVDRGCRPPGPRSAHAQRPSVYLTAVRATAVHCDG